jgi:AcrR family transcriptional regulator
VGSAQRRARAKENLRRAILDAARELFATEEYQAVSLRRIAEKIEYSPAAIYLHFQDKKEILFHLIEEGFEMLSARLEALQVADPVERLRQGAPVYLDFAFTQPHYYRLMFQLENKELGELMSQCAMADRAFNFIRRAVSEAMQNGQFVTATPEPVVSLTLWASLHGAASLVLTGHLSRKLPNEFHAAFFDHVIETVLRGLRA